MKIGDGHPTFKRRYVLGSKLPLFQYWGDGHQLTNRGLYMHAFYGFPMKGGMTIPNIGSLDPGTYRENPYLEDHPR